MIGPDRRCRNVQKANRAKLEQPSPESMSVQIRRIRPDEGHRLRALRLHALADAPMAFSSSLAREQAFADDVWRERATDGASGIDRVTFVAEEDGRWVGLATGLLAAPSDSDGAVPTLVGMFVDGSARRRGVGVALIESIARWVRDRGETRLVLWVSSDNEAAIALYHRCGFRPTGAARSLAHTPAHTEREMMRDLTSLRPP
jgi:GNAT superfamily N-acetyltransferase